MIVQHLTEQDPVFYAPSDCVIRALELCLTDMTLPWDTNSFAGFSVEGSQSANRESWLGIVSGFRPVLERGFFNGLELRLARGQALGLFWNIGSIGYIDANVFFDPV